MFNDQIVMGAGIAFVSAIGFFKANWILAETRKGQWLTENLGKQQASWTLHGVMLAGVVFGLLLATDFIRPMRW
ncbi:MAG: hypothetical protein Tsb009_23090 [Planctomycetaceae bacterium]